MVIFNKVFNFSTEILNVKISESECQHVNHLLLTSFTLLLGGLKDQNARMAVYCLTKISIRAKRSISRVFSLFIVPSLFFVHCPYKGCINRTKSVLTGLKPY